LSVIPENDELGFVGTPTKIKLYIIKYVNKNKVPVISR
jgi:hypothetical protein